MIYPNSVIEFRWLKKTNGIKCLQIRYVNANMGYCGSWQDIEIVEENDTTAST